MQTRMIALEIHVVTQGSVRITSRTSHVNVGSHGRGNHAISVSIAHSLPSLPPCWKSMSSLGDLHGPRRGLLMSVSASVEGKIMPSKWVTLRPSPPSLPPPLPPPCWKSMSSLYDRDLHGSHRGLFLSVSTSMEGKIMSAQWVTVKFSQFALIFYPHKLYFTMAHPNRPASLLIEGGGGYQNNF